MSRACSSGQRASRNIMMRLKQTRLPPYDFTLLRSDIRTPNSLLLVLVLPIFRRTASCLESKHWETLTL